MLLLANRKVLDEDLDEAAQEEAEDDIALLASAIAGGTSNQKVQQLAAERLSPDTNVLPGLTVGGAITAAEGELPILPIVLGGEIAGYLGAYNRGLIG